MIPIVSLMFLSMGERPLDRFPTWEMAKATAMIRRKKSHLRMGFPQSCQ